MLFQPFGITAECPTLHPSADLYQSSSHSPTLRPQQLCVEHLWNKLNFAFFSVSSHSASPHITVSMPIMHKCVLGCDPFVLQALPCHGLRAPPHYPEPTLLWWGWSDPPGTHSIPFPPLSQECSGSSQLVCLAQYLGVGCPSPLSCGGGGGCKAFMLQHWKLSHAICPGICLLAPFAACGISELLEMMGLDPMPTHIISHWENPRGCFSSELPAIGTKFMV